MSARIIAARRSAVVPRGGAFAGLRVEDLAAPVIAALLADAGLEPGAVEEVICAESIGQGGNSARRIALAAGLPERVAGLSIDRQCAGGLDAVALAAALVTGGRAQVVVAGGVESASRSPFANAAGRGFTQAPFTPWPDRDPDMAAAADRLGIPRAEQDAWAVESHAKARAVAGWPEIVPLAGQGHDAFARALTPALAARAPVLQGQITAANAAVAADAAAFVLVVSDRVARGRGARIIGAATVGANPEEPGLAAIPAMQTALAQAGLSPGRLSVGGLSPGRLSVGGLQTAEVMEAYAAQAIACVRGTGLDPARVNLKGGALARGHPIGASGAILAVRLFHDLREGPGLAGIAAAGGIGSALVLAPG